MPWARAISSGPGKPAENRLGRLRADPVGLPLTADGVPLPSPFWKSDSLFCPETAAASPSG